MSTALPTSLSTSLSSALSALAFTLHARLNRPGTLYRLTLALALKAAILLVLVPQLSPAQAAPAVESAAFQQALAQFEQAAAGKDDAVPAAAEQWRALMAATPTDPVLRAYAGSATTMQARAALLPWRKLSHAEDGLALLDKALAQLTPAHDAPGHRDVPAALEVRFIAANTFLALPGMFNRGERGARLLDEVVKSPLLAGAPAHFQAAVWLRAGSAAAQAGRKDEARQWLAKAAAVTQPAASASASAAAALLKTL